MPRPPFFPRPAQGTLDSGSTTVESSGTGRGLSPDEPTDADPEAEPTDADPEAEPTDAGLTEAEPDAETGAGEIGSVAIGIG